MALMTMSNARATSESGPTCEDVVAKREAASLIFVLQTAFWLARVGVVLHFGWCVWGVDSIGSWYCLCLVNGVFGCLCMMIDRAVKNMYPATGPHAKPLLRSTAPGWANVTVGMFAAFRAGELPCLYDAIREGTTSGRSQTAPVSSYIMYKILALQTAVCTLSFVVCFEVMSCSCLLISVAMGWYALFSWQQTKDVTFIAFWGWGCSINCAVTWFNAVDALQKRNRPFAATDAASNLDLSDRREALLMATLVLWSFAALFALYSWIRAEGHAEGKTEDKTKAKTEAKTEGHVKAKTEDKTDHDAGISSLLSSHSPRPVTPFSGSGKRLGDDV